MIEKELQKKVVELEEKIASLKRKKKYGLVWDNEKNPEKIVLDCKRNLPILREIKGDIPKNSINHKFNLLIEGDNYHSLSVLNYTHNEKVDIIYIDPPYNTGKEFIYNDKIVDSEDSYKHSKWLSFMEKRLKLAKELLKPDGVIFISIDYHEFAGLKLLCDEIFGERNLIGEIIWKKTENIKMDSSFISVNKEYILCYQKGLRKVFNKKLSDISRFNLKDEKGRYYLRKLDSKSSTYSKGMDYVIEHGGVKYYAGGSYENYKQRQKNGGKKKDCTWLWSEKKYKEGLENGEILFKNGNIYNKVRYDGIAKKPYIDIIDSVSVQTAQKELDKLFGSRSFDHPKPIKLIREILDMVRKEDSLVLDFFAGSGTTGHAVLEINKQENQNMSFILCTNNENGICENVTLERLKKVIQGYTSSKGETIPGLGGNLKYYKTDFVETENLDNATDQDKIELTYKAGEMIAIREETFEEIEKNAWWQIFSNGNEVTAIYFKEDKAKLQKLVEKLDKMNKKINLYIFSWGKNEYANEFPEYKNIKVKDIPEPLIDVYKEVANL